MRRVAGLVIAGVLLTASAVAAQQTVPDQSAASSSSSSSASAAPALPPPGCQDIVIDRSRQQTLSYYNEFLREVGHTNGHTAVHSLKVDIADCDATYFYVTEDATRAIMEPTDRYLGGRSAVLIRDVETVTKASLVPPPVKAAPAKAGSKKTSTKKPATAPAKKPG